MAWVYGMFGGRKLLFFSRAVTLTAHCAVRRSRKVTTVTRRRLFTSSTKRFRLRKLEAARCST